LQIGIERNDSEQCGLWMQKNKTTKSVSEIYVMVHASEVVTYVLRDSDTVLKHKLEDSFFPGHSQFFAQIPTQCFCSRFNFFQDITTDLARVNNRIYAAVLNYLISVAHIAYRNILSSKRT